MNTRAQALAARLTEILGAGLALPARLLSRSSAPSAGWTHPDQRAPEPPTGPAPTPSPEPRAEQARLQAMVGPRRRHRLSLVILTVALAIALVAASPAAAAAPTVNDSSAIDIGSTSAVISADISAGGVATEAHVEYGTTMALGSSTPNFTVGAGNTLMPLTGLTPETTYFFQVVAGNADGSDTGALMSFTTYGPPGSFVLPDNRGYEQVSPQDKNGYDIQQGSIYAALSGNGATFGSLGGFAGIDGTTQTNFYAAQRGPSEWSTHGLLPPIPATNSAITFAIFDGFTPELDQTITQTIPQSNPPEPFPLILRDASGIFHDVSPGLPPGPPPFFGGASDDFSHVVFEVPQSLCCSAPGGFVSNVYDFTGGQLELVSIDDTDTAVAGSVQTPTVLPGELNVPPPGAVSADGSRIFWRTPPGTNANSKIYLREDLSSTVEVSTSQRNPVDPNGAKDKKLWAATPDGRFAFFTSAEKLTDDATTGPTSAGNDLYRYDVDTGELVDLTVGDDATNGARVVGVLGVSDDGSRAYFVARGVLAAGATLGDNNLYVRDGNTTTFIATLAPGAADQSNWNLDATGFDNEKSSRVTPSGNALLFSSKAPQGDYDNAGFVQFYRYQLGDPAPTCVSCNPTGTPATGDSALTSVGLGFAEAFFLDSPPFGIYEPHNLSDDGSRAFFTSPERLVVGDTNERHDVYEWEGGKPHLISTGKSSEKSTFGDADPSGDNAFFVTRQQLTLSDQDTEADLYVARVGGGFPEQPPLPPCQGDQCLNSPSGAPSTPGAGSSTFVGPPNQSSTAKKKGCKRIKNRKKRKRCMQRKRCKRIKSKAKRKKCFAKVKKSRKRNRRRGN